MDVKMMWIDVAIRYGPWAIALVLMWIARKAKWVPFMRKAVGVILWVQKEMPDSPGYEKWKAAVNKLVELLRIAELTPEQETVFRKVATIAAGAFKEGKGKTALGLLLRTVFTLM